MPPGLAIICMRMGTSQRHVSTTTGNRRFDTYWILLPPPHRRIHYKNEEEEKDTNATVSCKGCHVLQTQCPGRHDCNVQTGIRFGANDGGCGNPTYLEPKEWPRWGMRASFGNSRQFGDLSHPRTCTKSHPHQTPYTIRQCIFVFILG